jgi:ribosomal protein S14
LRHLAADAARRARQSGSAELKHLRREGWSTQVHHFRRDERRCAVSSRPREPIREAGCRNGFRIVGTKRLVDRMLPFTRAERRHRFTVQSKRTHFLASAGIGQHVERASDCLGCAGPQIAEHATTLHQRVFLPRPFGAHGV